MMPHNDDTIRTVLYNGLLLEIQYSAGLIISTRLVQSNGFDSTPDIPYEHIDVRKLIPREYLYSDGVYTNF